MNLEEFADSLPDEMSEDRLNRVFGALKQYQEPASPKYLGTYHEDDRPISLPNELDTEELNELFGLTPEDKDYIPPEDTQLIKTEQRDELTPAEAPGLDINSPMSRWLGEPMSDEFYAQVDPEVQAAVEEDIAKNDGDLTISTAFQSWKDGLGESFSEDYHGGLMKFFIGMSAGDQATARTAVVALEELGKMSAEDATLLLSQEELHPSHIVDYYWKGKTRGSKYAQAITGIGSDILFDPLTYVTLGASGWVKLANKTYDLKKISSVERAYVKAAKQLDTVLDDAGNIVIPAGKEEVAREVIGKNLMKRESLSEDMAEGFAGPTVGFRLPFTTIGKEVSVPFVGRVAGKSVLGSKWAAGKLADTLDEASIRMIERLGHVTPEMSERILTKYNMAKDASSKTFNRLKVFHTNTGIPLFDAERMKFLNKEHMDDMRFVREEQEAMDLLSGAGPDLLKDIAEEIERTTIRGTGETLKAFGHRAYEPSGKKIINDITKEEFLTPIRKTKAYKYIEDTPEDLARKTRINSSEFGEIANDYVAKVAADNVRMVEEYSKRFPWFKELNPFGEDWARGYLKHIITKRWLNHFRNKEQALSEAKRFNNSKFKVHDRSAMGRQYRSTIQAANNESKIVDALGNKIPIFETDPIATHFVRMREMERVIRTHDFMKEIFPLAKNKYSPGLEPLFTQKQIKNFGDLLKQDKFEDLAFLPKEYLDILKKGENVYLPTNVKVRVDYMTNPRRDWGAAAMGVQALNWYTNMYKSVALYGPGYLGQNLFSNLITYGYAGGSGAKMLSIPTFLSPLNQSAAKIKLGKHAFTKEEFLKTLHEYGILRSSLIEEVNWNSVTDNLGSLNRYKRIPKLPAINMSKKEVATELFTGFKTMRWASRYGDDMPKAAFFASKLDEGYSLAGAMEATNFWFFNFNDVSPYVKKANMVVPFSSFAFKTLEQSIENFKRGRVAYMKLPASTVSVLQGAYIEDQNTINMLNSVAPAYMSWGYDKIHGPLLPGGKEVAIEAPYAQSTLSFLLNPDNAMHPGLQILFSSLGGYDQKYIKEGEEIDRDVFWRKTARAAEAIIPPPILNTLTIMQMNETIDLPMDFSNRYYPKLPQPGSSQVGIRSRQERLNNELDFMKWANKTYGDNFLYNMFFYQDPKGASKIDFDKLSVWEQRREAGRGNYIRKKFRQLGLGMARIEDMDRNFMTNHKSMGIVKKKLQDKLNEIAAQSGSESDLVDQRPSPGRIKKLQKINEEARVLGENINVLTDKMKALEQYYDTYLKSKEEAPGFIESIMGLDEEKINTDPLPRPESPLRGESDE